MWLKESNENVHDLMAHLKLVVKFSLSPSYVIKARAKLKD